LPSAVRVQQSAVANSPARYDQFRPLKWRCGKLSPESPMESFFPTERLSHRGRSPRVRTNVMPSGPFGDGRSPRDRHSLSDMEDALVRIIAASRAQGGTKFQGDLSGLFQRQFLDLRQRNLQVIIGGGSLVFSRSRSTMPDGPGSTRPQGRSAVRPSSPCRAAGCAPSLVSTRMPGEGPRYRAKRPSQRRFDQRSCSLRLHGPPM
jgi:hypothetical protein